MSIKPISSTTTFPLHTHFAYGEIAKITQYWYICLPQNIYINWLITTSRLWGGDIVFFKMSINHTVSHFLFFISITKFWYFSSLVINCSLQKKILKKSNNFCLTRHSWIIRLSFRWYADRNWWAPFAIFEAFEHFRTSNFKSIVTWENNAFTNCVIKFNWRHATTYCSSRIRTCSHTFKIFSY